MIDARAYFLEALAERGLALRGDLVLGRLTRCDVIGRNGKNDGAYIYYEDRYGVAWGGMENHKDGLGWESWHLNGQECLDSQRRIEHWNRSMQKQLELERQSVSASWGAHRYWAHARDADERHGYLRQKRVGVVEGVRQCEGELIIPLHCGHEFCSVQIIDEAGGKRFWSSARVDGAYFELKPVVNGEAIALCEGYATAYSVMVRTGCCAVMALDAGNLPKVAVQLKHLYPASPLYIYADNDFAGIHGAELAHIATNAIIILPPEKGMDFNDIYLREEEYATRSNQNHENLSTTTI